jgi:hypothetical protein
MLALALAVLAVVGATVWLSGYLVLALIARLPDVA